MTVEEQEKERRLPPPMGIAELLKVEEPKEDWLVEGLIPAAGNVLLAGYPKTFKTMWLLELAVALASETPFLGKFKVPQCRRVGIVLMEDQAHRVRTRLKRLCAGRDITLDSLDGWLHFWFRPPLRLDDITAVELADYDRELDLDFLGLDSWAYVASGDSNSADEVTPQLQALSEVRLERPNVTVLLTHHARKELGQKNATRLTDTIRNSSAFGAWYDAGLVLARKDETSPVTVRAELRDYAAPEAFAFTVEDEHPAGHHNGFRAGGWLRLEVSEHRPELVQRMTAVEKLVPPVREFLRLHPNGVSRTKLREGVRGNNENIEAAFNLLLKGGEAEHFPSEGKGKPSVYRLLVADPAQPCPNPAPSSPRGDLAHPAPPPVGGGRGQGPRPDDNDRGRGKGADAAPDLFDQRRADEEEEPRWSI